MDGWSKSMGGILEAPEAEMVILDAQVDIMEANVVILEALPLQNASVFDYLDIKCECTGHSNSQLGHSSGSKYTCF